MGDFGQFTPAQVPVFIGAITRCEEFGTTEVRARFRGLRSCGFRHGWRCSGLVPKPNPLYSPKTHTFQPQSTQSLAEILFPPFVRLKSHYWALVTARLKQQPLRDSAFSAVQLFFLGFKVATSLRDATVTTAGELGAHLIQPEITHRKSRRADLIKGPLLCGTQCVGFTLPEHEHEINAFDVRQPQIMGTRRSSRSCKERRLSSSPSRLTRAAKTAVSTKVCFTASGYLRLYYNVVCLCSNVPDCCGSPARLTLYWARPDVMPLRVRGRFDAG